MDYKTKPTSRKDLRSYSRIVRRLFDVPETGPFPVLLALDRVGSVFKNCYYIVVEDNRLPPQTMARCVPNDIPVTGPNGKTKNVIAVYQIDNGQRTPRMITNYLEGR